MARSERLFRAALDHSADIKLRRFHVPMRRERVLQDTARVGIAGHFWSKWPYSGRERERVHTPLLSCKRDANKPNRAISR